MAKQGDENGNRASLIVVLIVIIIAVAAVAYFIFTNAQKKDKNDYSVVTQAELDEAAVDGMLDGATYSGARNPDGVLSYRINSEITVSGGEGDFQIENPPKNTCLMKVTFVLDGETIYESGYILPNQHIDKDKLDTVPEAGEYTVKVVFEGFDPGTLESLGVCETEIKLTVE